MADTHDLQTILPLIEETLEVSRENLTLTRGIEIQVREITNRVEKHDVSLYHADEGGIVGRVARVEDRLNAKIKAVEDKLAPIMWVGGVLGGLTLSWIVGQVLGLIKP